MTNRLSGCAWLAVLVSIGQVAFGQSTAPALDDRLHPAARPPSRPVSAADSEKQLPAYRHSRALTTPLTQREAVDSLTPSDLAEFLPLLHEHYIGASKLTDEELSRATIQGVLDRIAPGARIIDAPVVPASAESPFRSELISASVAYIRLGAVSPANVAALDEALQRFSAAPPTALILDLRATPAGSEFEQAAEVCQRFCPKGNVLFSIKKPNQKQELLLTSKEEPRYRGLLVALVARETAGAAEVIAAVLRAHGKAMVIGQTTKGEAVEFSDFPLPSGKLLRIAVAEVALRENVSVFPGGVKPDLAVEVARETHEAVLQAGLEKGVTELIIENERPRMNEAALIAGANPELEAYQAAQGQRGERSKSPLRDVVLQRALDFITSVQIYESKARRDK